MAVIDMTATRVWVKEVTTNIFYRGTRRLYGTEFMKRHRKTIIGVSFLLWIAGVLAGYGVYRRAVEMFHNDAKQQVQTELTQGIENTNFLMASIYEVVRYQFDGLEEITINLERSERITQQTLQQNQALLRDLREKLR